MTYPDIFSNSAVTIAIGLDAQIDAALAPLAEALSAIVFFSATIGGAEVPLIVAWLIAAGVFFTLYLGGINVVGLPRAWRLLLGRTKAIAGANSKAEAATSPDSPIEHRGEISAWGALATAISGTVGIGNIGGVAVVITVGGPGAVFWLIVAGLLGMATKCAECVLGVHYRAHHSDGSVSGGPMYYLRDGLAERGFPRVGRALGAVYAAAIVVGCLGIGNMFQSNQAYRQMLVVTGGVQGLFAERGWLFGLGLAVVVGLVIVGGIRSIARVTSRLVPLMAGIYLVGGFAVIAANADRLPAVLTSIVKEAFAPTGITGGALAVMALGFQRAAFSNEAGLGSAAIAHSAVRTHHPATEGYVALLEPLIDTVVICTTTALVILTTVYTPEMTRDGVQGIELTSAAFESVFPGSSYLVAIAALLFALSTMIAWSYYGLKGWTYLLGRGKGRDLAFKAVFLAFAVLGCTLQLDSVLTLSDALVFVVAVPNIIGLYVLAPRLKSLLFDYRAHE